MPGQYFYKSASPIGAYVSASETSATNFPATTAYGDLTSITLTPGDWDISLVGHATANGATVTQILFGVSTTSGNSATGLITGDNQAITASGSPSVNGGSTLAVPSVRVQPTVSTTYYLKYRAVYTVATPQAVGRISARRMS